MMNDISLSQIIGKDGVFVDGDWVESKDQDPNGSVRLVQLADIGEGVFINKSHRFLTTAKAAQLRCTYLKPGDVLIARMPDPIGRACIFPELNVPCVTVVDVCIVRPDRMEVSPEWLMHLVNSEKFRDRIKKYVTGTTRQRISRGNLEKIKFDVPSLDEQKRIVKRLVQSKSLSLNRKQSLNLLNEYLNSVYLEMFGDPILNPKRWDTTEFSKVCIKILGGGTPSKSKPEYYEGQIPWVTPKDMKRRFISDSQDHISNNAVEESSVKLIPVDSILMVIRSGILKKKLPVAINTKNVTINQDMKAYVINPSIVNQYFVLFFFELAQQFLLNKVRAVTADNINSDDIKNCPIILPPISLQNKFADIVHQNESLKQKMVIQSEELELLYQSSVQNSFHK